MTASSPSDTRSLALQIDAILPQTQCTKCGFNGCLPYAEAIATHQAQINRCSPGGVETIAALAQLLGKEPLPVAEDVAPTIASSVAYIDEERCIGCALCLKACPVDAIVGAGKLMHTVISDWCTGCELCIPRCPVDCISLVQTDTQGPNAEENRERYEGHQERYRVKEEMASTSGIDKQAMLRAALERARKK